VLEQRIARRTEAMVAEGLVAEVEGLAQRYGADLPLLQTLGYGEILRYLQGDWRLDQAISAIVTHTRQFAKRQRTWFRHRAQVHWLNAAAPDLVDQAWGILNQVQ
jgi:tRNA dimethylallyltransferase